MATILTVGCFSDHGGKIITGDSSMLIDGKPVARIGDLHSCPRYDGDRPHGVEPIIASSIPNRPTVNGVPLACSGDKTACGAILLPSVSSSKVN